VAARMEVLAVTIVLMNIKIMKIDVDKYLLK